jgi:protein-S-isoprenylcysteine O-methyltransferase Ste14
MGSCQLIVVLLTVEDNRVDAPSFRIWPPLAIGVPFAFGVVLTATLGDPVSVASALARWTGALLVGAFVNWNGWTLLVMAWRRTSIVPGGPTTVLLQVGPFRRSRNPLYLGLLALDIGLSLLLPSFWALVFVPIGGAALFWGAIRPEERYLSAKFGADYGAYRDRVRRWM